MSVITSFGEAAGDPAIDRSTCDVCGQCAKVCPSGVLSKEGGEIRVDHAAGFDCIACGQCMMACSTGSIAVTGRKLSPSDLIPAPDRNARATFDQLEALLLSRRSIRRFREEPVTREAVDRVIASAATAPMGIPPWEVGVTVFHGRDKVRELAWDIADAYEKILNSFEGPLGRIFRRLMKKAARQQLKSFILPLGRIYVEGKKRNTDNILYDAPAALLFHTSPFADAADAVIACTYAMVAAESMGLGTCMIGSVAPVLERRKDLMEKHGLPPGNIPRIVLIMGHPAVRFRKAIRRPFLSVQFR
ncbi:MAG: nitroreductase family protein [Thermodesulfobacteriota bacterium]